MYLWVYFWALYSVPLIYMPVFVPVPYSFDYCSFVIFWNQGAWCLQLCSSFSWLFWLFRVFYVSTQILELFVLALWKMTLVCFFWFFVFNLAALCSLQDLSSPTRDWTRALAVKVPSPNHWTAREFPDFAILIGITLNL